MKKFSSERPLYFCRMFASEHRDSLKELSGYQVMFGITVSISKVFSAETILP